MALRYDGDSLHVLDQRQLPNKEEWLESRTIDQMIEHIATLTVRGAPLIGICAALQLGLLKKSGANRETYIEAAEALRRTRPTAVNLMWAIDKMKDNYDEAETAALQIFEEDRALCERIAENGSNLIKDGDSVLTHCNTGSLATGGVGTALGIITKAHQQGKNIHVYVDETRPLLQGGRLTTWELQKLGIPYTLICDNMAAALMRDGKVDSIFVGADRIALNGDFANKTGTYGLAVSARFHKVPFYAAAPYTTVDFELANGKDIPIEERDSFEVRGVRGSFGEIEWGPKDSSTYNPAFDVTPGELLSGIVFDSMFLNKKDIANGKIKDLNR